MQKKYETFLLISIDLVAAMLLLVNVRNVYEEKAHKEKQVGLAATMNVSLAEYPDLPDEYFPMVIKPGMTLEQVHKITVGYEKVFYDQSSDGFAYYEIYYYFNADPDQADRIMISYDHNYVVMRLFQEDEDSRTLISNGWPEGQLMRR